MGEISITIKTKYNIGDIVIFRSKSNYCCGIIKEISYDRGNQNIEYIIGVGRAMEKVTELDVLTTVDPTLLIQLIKSNQLLVEKSIDEVEKEI